LAEPEFEPATYKTRGR